ncbi:c-type cytochrome biogenesis protein CcmI [Thalassotalea insulae]|uniref:C-type cytochrome biogenesis protein CcmI n=1 Tax=Thalassotalea insulae TaxID=2056778 RepID=A0ABQ6GUZ3_9GAMM|nr:c-type cytochrome biogenesis protein CcmI [Thalassotalea insulae]GLX79174.1 c-type cytochrome biogenesis protein CcmI [Thalassotalea insulae]
MIELLIIVIALVLLLLVVIWGHFLTQNRHQAAADNSFRDQTNVRLYHEHKAEIEQDYQQGALDSESYQYLKTELDQSLLQDIEDNSKEARQQHSDSRQLSIFWPVVLSVFILGFSGYFYQQNGAFDLIASTPQARAGHEMLDEQQQVIVQVQKLKQLTEQQPKNADAWYQLGQALVGIGEFSEALSAFDQVIAIDGEHADLYGAKAQASYYQNQQRITPQVQGFIDKALALDARDPSTNILLGMDQFTNKAYQQAIDYWQLVIADARPTVNIEALQGAIDEAKNRLSLTSGVIAKNTGLPAPELALHVSISEEIAQQLSISEDNVVFVYAIPANGSRMPLAAVKLKASDLPIDVVLNDARAMSPQAKLSDAEKVHLYAIISSDGGVGIKSGDYKAELQNIDVRRTTPIELVIDSVVQ